MAVVSRRWPDDCSRSEQLSVRGLHTVISAAVCGEEVPDTWPSGGCRLRRLLRLPDYNIIYIHT